MTFKRIYLAFCVLFAVYACWHAGRYYQIKRSLFEKPFILYVEQLGDSDVHKCRESSNCMDVLSWDDLCTRADLGLE